MKLSHRPENTHLYLKTQLEIKKYSLRSIKNDDWAIYALALNKSRLEAPLKTKSGKKKLYNFLSRFLVEKLPLSDVERNVEMRASSPRSN